MAGLVTVRREGRSMIYAARFETMNALLAFLTENCCGGRAGEMRASRGLQAGARQAHEGAAEHEVCCPKE